VEPLKFPLNRDEIDIDQVIQDMFETMYNFKGIGLSANQVGLPYRMFVMGTPDIEMVFLNPRIVSVDGEEVVAEEGCLSYPGMFIKVKRPSEVVIRSTNTSGETKTQTYTGMTARVVLHEMDHLDGINYQKRATRFHLEQARNQHKKLQRKIKRG
jgi:peptide deformylase